MENRKWLKRRYSKTFNDVNEFLNDSQLNDFKKQKYKIGVLINDIIQVQRYRKGELIMFKRSNPVTSFNYPMHHGIIKCDVGFTSSGYHSIDIFDKDFIEITN